MSPDLYNIFTSASQSNGSILVVNATKGEFETGFDKTREHALFIWSLGKW